MNNINVMSLIKNFWIILSNNQRTQAIFVLILMFSVSILETFGIALVIPIMSTILEQSSSIRAQLSIFVPYISQLTEREFVVLGILFLLTSTNTTTIIIKTNTHTTKIA